MPVGAFLFVPDGKAEPLYAIVRKEHLFRCKFFTLIGRRARGKGFGKLIFLMKKRQNMVGSFRWWLFLAATICVGLLFSCGTPGPKPPPLPPGMAKARLPRMATVQPAPANFLLTWEWPGDWYGFSVYRLNLAGGSPVPFTSTTNRQCEVSNSFASAFFTVQDWRWITWDKNLETNVAGYILSCSLTNATPTNMVMLRSVTLATNGASMNLLFSGMKSGPYKIWVQARNAEGLLSSLECDDCWTNVYWQIEPIKLRLVRQ